MFQIPNNSERTTVMGMTGSGKTQGGAFLLAGQPFEQIPWVILNFKNEGMFYEFNPFPLPNWIVPNDPGIYMIDIDLDLIDIEIVNDFLRAIKSRGSCGLFIDEGTELEHSKPLRSILTQGRSLEIPIILCTQRPKHVTISAFTEANYYMIFDLNHPDDKKLVAGYVGRKDELPELPRYHFWWYDRINKELSPMRPVPDRDIIIANIAGRQKALAEKAKSKVYL
jgi:hypothetical protein